MSETDVGQTVTPGTTALPAGPMARSRPAALNGLRTASHGHASALQVAVLLVIAGGIVAAGQLIEDVNESGRVAMLTPADSIQRWTIVAAVVYMVLIVMLMEREIRHSLASLRPVVQVSDAAYASSGHDMGHPSLAVELMLLAVSAFLVTLLFAVGGSDLPIKTNPASPSTYLPGDPLAAIVVLAGYAAFGWAGLSLVFTTIRSAAALGRLSHEPVTINVYDTSDLLSFGRMALAVSLAPAGLIALFLLGLGRPTSPLAWAVLTMASFASILALVLPLRGIHHQMAVAKQSAFTGLSAQLARVNTAWNASGEMPAPEVANLTNRTNGLIALRKTVTEMRTWPFQGPIAFGRAVLFASAPLIYAALSEVIKTIWITPLVH